MPFQFSRNILEWFHDHKRRLPWRETADPYKIWVSEVILQQTRVEQGLEYYRRFLERFPDVAALAMATEEAVMKAWQGLGYYTRARNMHQAARMIMDTHQGRFPDNYPDIRRLRGIGDYTAAAIASIAFGQVYPVIDGNVKRVMARFLGMNDPVNSASGYQKILGALQELIDPAWPGPFNESVMELGALVCKPRQPLCLQCPLKSACFAFNRDMTESLPVIARNKPAKTRFFHYVVIKSKVEYHDYIWLHKRKEDDIWKNLYDFPLIEAERELNLEEIAEDKRWIALFQGYPVPVEAEVHKTSHILTHRKLQVSFFTVNMPGFSHPDYLKVDLKDIHNYPVPRLIENILKIVAHGPGIFFKFPD